MIVILYVQQSLMEEPQEPLNTTINGIFTDLNRVFTDHPDHDKYTYEEGNQNRCSEFVKEGPSYTTAKEIRYLFLSSNKRLIMEFHLYFSNNVTPHL